MFGTVCDAGKRSAIWSIGKVKTMFRKFILMVNYTIVVIICLTLVAQTQLPIIERALFGFGAIFIGMGIRWIVNTLMPPDVDNLNNK